jgi:uracil-DNA glycosylase
MTLATEYRACETCHTRVLLAPGVPALNWAQDPAGQVAVTFTHPRAARFLAKGEEPGALEHRHSEHRCADVEEVADDGA